MHAALLAEGGLLADALGPGARRGRRARAPPPRPARARAGARPTSPSSSRRSARASCCTTAPRGCSGPIEPDLALLAGDRLYALGLARLAQLGDVEAVSELADVIALCAQARAEGRPRAGRRGLAGGRGRGRLGRRRTRCEAAKAAARGGRSWRGGRPPGGISRGLRYVDLSGDKVRPAVHGRRPPTDQEQVHRRPHDPGRLRGRDGDAAAVHDRARPTSPAPWPRRPSCCPALGFALGPVFEKHEQRWQAVGAPDDFPVDHLRAQGHHDRRRHRAGRQDDDLHPQARPEDRHRQARPVQPVHRDLHALHAPRLPGALRGGRRALHLPVPRRRLRLHRQGRRRPAGAPARPLLHRACATARSRSARATRSTEELKRFSPRDPAEPLDGIGQYLYPSRPTIRKLPGT